MDKVKLDAITEKIIGTAHKVSNTLGIGFVEKVYENAHAHEMRKDGLTVVQQHPIKVVYDDIVVGDFFVDPSASSLTKMENESTKQIFET